jgi:hypothetical protein
MVGSMTYVYTNDMYISKLLYIKCIQITQNMKGKLWEHVENSKHKLEYMLCYVGLFYNITTKRHKCCSFSIFIKYGP